MQARSPLNKSVRASGGLLPQEVTLASTNWLNRARHYAVFSPTWYRHRSIAVLAVVTAGCILVSVLSPVSTMWKFYGGSNIGAIAIIVLVPLYLLCLVGPGLAVVVRQRSLAPHLEAAIIVFVILGAIAVFVGLATALGTRYERPAFDPTTGILTTKSLPALKAKVNFEVSGGGHTFEAGPEIDKKYRPEYISPKRPEKSIDEQLAEIRQIMSKWGMSEGPESVNGKMTFTAKGTTAPTHKSLDYGPAIGWGMVLGAIGWIGGLFDLFAYFFQRNRIVDVLQREEVRRAQAARNAAELRLSVLAAQIEPHFLFNTLASVRSAIATDRQRATHIVDHMVNYLRSTIPQMRDDALNVTVNLLSQMESVRSYLALMHERIPRLQFSVGSEAGLDTAQMPPLMLISLVENAVKHGIEPKIGAAHVEVTARRVDGECGLQLEVSVTDDGVGFGDTTSGDGIGLSNIQERLRTLFGASASLALKTLPGGGVAAILRLPLSFEA